MERFKTLMADLLFPEGNACHLCGRGLDETGTLCERCLSGLRSCRYSPTTAATSVRYKPLRVCISAYSHRDEARELVHRFKYDSDCAAAQVLGQDMAAVLLACPAQPKRIDAVVPVPLHASRLEMRGYNQALLLAQAVCAHSGLSLVPDALVRLYDTGTQVPRDREARMQAMRSAFAVADSAQVRGRSILLVDDVLTTGATAMSCAAALLDAGVRSVSLLTACRA